MALFLSPQCSSNITVTAKLYYKSQNADSFVLEEMASYSRQAYLAEDPGGVLRDIEVDEEAMMSPHRVDQGGIPLVCYACEKIPTFSDLSHLITHVSSKAHLLELYNLRIKSYGNEACAAQARKFEIWNQTYNIDQLVRQRMEARDEKGIQPQRRGYTQRDEASGRSTARRGARGTRGRRGNVVSLTLALSSELMF